MATRLVPARPARHLIWTGAATLIGTILIFGLSTLMFGRMWAEEASDFLPGVIDRDFGSATFHTYRGTLQIPTNWAVWAAARFALLHAPLVTFWASVAVLLMLGSLFGWWARVTGVSPQMAALGFFAFLMVQSVDEVIGTSTNFQWLFSLCALLLLIMPEAPLAFRLGRLGCLIALAGLDGVPSCMLAPAFLFRARVDRSRVHAIFGAILCATSLVQAVLLLSTPQDGRSFAFEPGLFLVSLVLHTANAFGPEQVIHAIGLAFLDGKGRAAIVLASAAIGAIALFGLGRMARSGGMSDEAPFRLITLGLLVTLLNLFGVIGEPSRMAMPPLDGRYFVLMIFCMILLLVVATRSPRLPVRGGAMLLLGLAAAIGAARHVEALLAGLPQAPHWADQIEACHARAGPVCRLVVLPIESDGAGWPALLPKAVLAGKTPPRRLP